MSQVTETAAPVQTESKKAPAEKVQLKKSVLAQEIEDGNKIEYFLEKYGLPETQMRAALRQCGLKIRKFHEPKFEFVDDTPENQLGLFAGESAAEEVVDTVAEEIQPEPVAAGVEQVAAEQAKPLDF